tara:strand:- start:517 stop:903 length:387 start_codon:yes stop_codon:yes gene_type:complete
MLFTACLLGYTWLYYNVAIKPAEGKQVEVCLIKYHLNIPCPSCGSTRSIISMLKGDFNGALKKNPFGYLIAIIMIIIPPWIITDTIKGTKTLFNFYLKAETYLKKRKIVIPLILIVIINWIWNITKGL